MGANVSRQSGKGLNGRRAQSSGDLCNGDSSKSQTGSSVSDSVHGEAMGWNRSLPNHLDSRRHTREYEDFRPAENNNYRQAIEYGRHSRCDKRGSRYRKRDPGCDQGYGSERSPEEEFPPSLPVEDDDYEDYESQLRRMYPFITEENTFTVVVEKDCRGLGLSVTGGVGAAGAAGAANAAGAAGGLVRIRRLYPPQPAWSTGRLAPGDLLLAANGVPLAGLTSYEALEVLRTTPAVVELSVCRPGAWLDAAAGARGSPPPPPARAPPAPPAPPPPDPLNCHPAHARLARAGSAAASASLSEEEGYGAVHRPSSSFSNAGTARANHFNGSSFGSSSAISKPEPIPRTSLRLPDFDQGVPLVFDVQYDGEFDIVMTKVNGSLGFTLRKEDHSALGHYVRALVREPALSDGRIRPGDRIVAVNDISMSNLSHSEAVAFLRQCGDEVRLRLFRDNAATPLSAMSPTESDAVLPMKPKRQFRQEAVNMLCDLAARKLTPEKGDGLSVLPRKCRKITSDSTGLSQDNAQPNSIHNPESMVDSNSEGEWEGETNRPERPHSLDLAGPPTPVNNRKQRLHFTAAAHGYELNNLDNDVLDAPNIYQDSSHNATHYLSGNSNVTSEPISMPVNLNADRPRDDMKFCHKNPAYQSAVLQCNNGGGGASSSEGHKDDGHGLKKWKGVTLSPDNERKPIKHESSHKENTKPGTIKKEQSHKQENNANCAPDNTDPLVISVEMNRGWNSRLGFSIQPHPRSGHSYISAIYSDSVAARDGRLRQGDIILQVNDENVTTMKTSDIIDLLRILRGSICITVLRPHKQ